LSDLRYYSVPDEARFGVRRVLAALRQQPTCRLRGIVREAQVPASAVFKYKS
jgi:hypothetical protein